MSHRFLYYIAELSDDSDVVRLTGDEHHHAATVLRVRGGEEIFVTNGAGVLARAEVVTVDRDSTALRVVGRETPTAEADVTLALACLKKEAFASAVRSCTELGVRRVLPFAAERSHLTAYSQAFLDRVHRITLSAMKQSFRSVLPEVHEPVTFDELCEALPRYRTILVGDADGPVPSGEPLDVPVIAVVGPEAGLTPDELDHLDRAGARRASVSAHRLRSETAAATLVATALLRLDA